MLMTSDSRDFNEGVNGKWLVLSLTKISFYSIVHVKHF